MTAREKCDECKRLGSASCLACPWGSGPEGAPVLFVEADEWSDDQ
jgi:hypothetical protein